MDRAAADETFMRAALVEAAKGLGQTSPNPAVGAILVAGGEIIARGHHRRAGLPHAEIECLRRLRGPVPNESTLYVTLEPCSTTGRTPPCTAALIEAGIRNVVIGASDPNPKHSGRGLNLLAAAGINVRTNVLAEECLSLNEAFNTWILQKRPFVIAKCAMTLDGRLTRLPGEERWISSPAARAHANAFRSQVDAILIGAETLRADNPRLTVRGIRGARQPLRVIMTRSGRTPRTAHVFNDRFLDRTLVFQNKKLEAVLEELGQRDVTSVLIEGGGDVLGQALDARLIDKVRIYFAPLLTGGPVLAFVGEGANRTEEALRLGDVRYETIGGNVFLSANATYPSTSSED